MLIFKNDNKYHGMWVAIMSCFHCHCRITTCASLIHLFLLYHCCYAGHV